MRAERIGRALLFAALAPCVAPAADAPPVPKPAPAPVPAMSGADAELLEFLGEFDDAQSGFVDPFAIDGAERELRAAARAAEKEKAEQTKAVTKTVEPAPEAAPPEKKP